MASGDAVNGLESVNDSAFITIQPAAGVEWIIHNLFVPDGESVDVYLTGSAGSILIMSVVTSLFQHNFHLTNTQYLTMQNVSGGILLLGYDGIVVK
jgi:hypothetical protein